MGLSTMATTDTTHLEDCGIHHTHPELHHASQCSRDYCTRPSEEDLRADEVIAYADTINANLTDWQKRIIRQLYGRRGPFALDANLNRDRPNPKADITHVIAAYTSAQED
jgi:hypothetical protein